MNLDFILSHMVNRPDAYGQYAPTGKTFKVDGAVDQALIEKHLAGEITIGLYTTSTDQTCRWAAWDIDCHEGEDPWANKEVAKDLYNRIEKAGFYPVLEDSDGAGGFHIWVIFDEPLPARYVYEWARSFPMPDGIEVFPKQPKISKYGNYIRIPGKHHKRDHWSRFWEGEDQWSREIDPELSESSMVPAVAESPEEGAPDGLEDLARMQTAEDARIFNRCVAALDRLSPDRANQYENGWIDVGMILHRYDPGPHGLAVWENWSKQSTKYEPGVCDKHWKSFDRSKETTKGIGTLMHMVQGDDPRELDLPEAERVKIARDRLGEKLGIQVDRWVQRGTEAGSVKYYLETGGQVVEFDGFESWQTAKKFEKPIAEVLRISVAPECKKAAEWDRIVKDFFLITEVEEIEEDTRVGQVREILENYLTFRMVIEVDDSFDQEDKHELRASKRPFIESGLLYVSVSNLCDYLRRSKIDFRNPYKVLRSVGWIPQMLRTGSSTVRFWSIPASDPCVPGITVSYRKGV